MTFIIIETMVSGTASAASAELIGCFNLIFYCSVEDAVFKALGAK